MNELTGKPDLVIVSGLSGSGKSVALNTLEDLDFYCVDNLPAGLLPDFVDNVMGSEAPPGRLAVGIDVRNRSGDLHELPDLLAAVAPGGSTRGCCSSTPRTRRCSSAIRRPADATR